MHFDLSTNPLMKHKPPHGGNAPLSTRLSLVGWKARQVQRRECRRSTAASTCQRLGSSCTSRRLPQACFHFKLLCRLQVLLHDDNTRREMIRHFYLP